ncbi:MAG TPA: hydrogenase maturation protease [Lacunisphaera sp.]|jgi:hydrogenase maturation protease|nr:hydrogenase maturation protease [Lacunisphaera sp.]
MPAAVQRAAALLVIGYGNTLRTDDGAGRLVAERVEELGLAGVRARPCAQLTPDLAPELAGAATVVFVDATVALGREIRWKTIAPDDNGPVSSHAMDPSALLALARELYGRAPLAWLLTVPTERMEIGTELSDLTRRGIEAAIEKVVQLAKGAGGGRLMAE